MKKHILYTSLLLMSFFGCKEVIFEEDLSKSIIKIIAPAEGTTVETKTVNFNWEPLENTTSYHLQIAKPNFNTAVQIVMDTLVKESTSFSTSLGISEYEWRVKGKNSGSETNYVSAKFKIAEPVDFTKREVVLTFPSINYATPLNKIEFKWETVNEATTYNIQLLDKDNNIISEEKVNTISKEFENIPETITKWQVIAENTTGEKTATFFRSIIIDRTAPNKPTNYTNTITDKTVKFTWTRVAIAGSDEYDVLSISKDAALSSVDVKKEDITTFGYEHTFTDTVLTKYYWRIDSYDKAGNITIGDIKDFTLNP